jgi:hypothetical protein
MSKHTPGPWGRNIKPGRKYPVIFSGRNTHVALAIGGTLPDSEIEANIDLIAAAPCLLSALELISEIPGGTVGSALTLAKETARAALAKARGQA